MFKVQPEEDKKSEPALNIKREAQNTNNREQKKELLKVQKQFSKAEEHLNQLNTEKINFESELSKPENYADKNRFLQLESGYKSVQQKIESLNKQYEELFGKIIELEELVNNEPS